MPPPHLRRITVADRTAAHVREGIREGRWKNHLPGALKLAEELGVSRNTIDAAIRRLLVDGVIARSGDCRPHRIVARTAPAGKRPPVLRIALLLMDALEKLPTEAQREVFRVMAEVKTAGHECVTVTFPFGKDRGKTGRLPRLLNDVGADAWMVLDGTREILRRFAENDRPVLALGGSYADLPIAVCAAYELSVVVREALRKLIGLGHERIVLICPRGRRLPTPLGIVRAFREELQSAGLKSGDYNTPDWEESPGGLEALLRSLFRVTPPTAIVCEYPHTVAGVLGFLNKTGLRIPGDVSVVSLWYSEMLSEWAFPGVRLAHMEGDEAAYYRRIREWVTNVSRGRADTRRFIDTARLVEGDTIGPAKGHGRDAHATKRVPPAGRGTSVSPV